MLGCSRLAGWLAVALVLAPAGRAGAQVGRSWAARPGNSLGGSIVVLRSRGALSRELAGAAGFALDGVAALDRAGVLGVRGELQAAVYDFGGAGDTSETRGIYGANVGGQLQLPRGAVRPYVAATVGVAAFLTERSYACAPYDYGCSGLADENGQVRSTAADGISFAVTRRAGVRVPTARLFRGGPSAAVDVAVGVQQLGLTGYRVDARREARVGRPRFVAYTLGVTLSGR